MAIIVGLVVLACCVVLFWLALRIGAAILRTAVRLTNACLGGRDLEENDYRHRASAYEAIPRPKSLGGIRIPVPGVGYAILVNIASAAVGCACSWAALAVGGVALGLAVPEPTASLDPAAATALLGVLAVAQLANVFGAVVVLKFALPTTIVRAVVVVIWQFVLCVVPVVLLGAAMVMLGATSGPVSVPTLPGQGGWVR
ncbi:hypothetical protein [Urbifossiella limnaea]|uniref:Uncharacterized protein n=1 Tax=Urbifossiella limnaea TaxID=2528023 RepID=A0A517XXM4_9BACT|nr:hypothetical protein [Urbifossiella limnaea]QDU22262.1 hypothetical protein ETAA1_42390 [Urbifossiella limnaea]